MCKIAAQKVCKMEKKHPNNLQDVREDSSWTVTDPLRRTEKGPLPGAFPGRGPALLSAVRDDHYRLGQTRHVSLVERTEPVHRLDVAGYLLGVPAHPLALAFFHGAITSRARVYIGAGAAL